MNPAKAPPLFRRQQPIRDKILSFLRVPRSARQVALHIGREVPVATGHLAAMRRRGLVRRLGYSAYALADYAGPPLRWSAAKKSLVVDEAGSVRNATRETAPGTDRSAPA